MVGWHDRLNEHESVKETVKDREAWHAAVHGVTKGWTKFSNGTTTAQRQ